MATYFAIAVVCHCTSTCVRRCMALSAVWTGLKWANVVHNTTYNSSDNLYGGPLQSCCRFIFHSTCALRTRRANVDMVDVRTSSSACVRRTRSAKVKLDVRTQNSTCTSETWHEHVNHIYVRTSSSTCTCGDLHANVDMVDVRTWSEK